MKKIYFLNSPRIMPDAGFYYIDISYDSSFPIDK